MPIRFESGLTDDNDFVLVVRAIVEGVLARHAPKFAWVIQVDNWFDHKWLRFSGNGSVANPHFARIMPGDSLAVRFDSVKAEFNQSKVTIPPFSPNRILGQWPFIRFDNEYREFPLKDAPHPWEKERSAANLHRGAAREDTGFFWYSGNTLKNDRGSLMTYLSQGREVGCWYAEFIRQEKWRLGRTKEINREEISRFAGAGLDDTAD
jgi:hypothetical protein